MMLNTVCASCRRAIRREMRSDLVQFIASAIQPRRLPSTAFISTTSRALAAQQRPPPPPTAYSPQPPPPASSSTFPPAPGAFTDIASRLRSSEALRGTTEPLVAYGVTESLFAECSKQCSYTIPSILETPPTDPPKTPAGEDLGEGQGWWFAPRTSGGLALDTTFHSWAQVMFLHMYALTVRLRGFPAAHVATWQQNLLDHFFYAAEDRMVIWHGMTSRGVRNRYLKDLHAQWRGVLVSYDEGLIKGDAVLAGAVWRNVFKAKMDANVADVALVTAHLRAQIAKLEKLSDGEVSSAQVVFDAPVNALSAPGMESRLMKTPFTKEDLSAMGSTNTA